MCRQNLWAHSIGPNVLTLIKSSISSSTQRMNRSSEIKDDLIIFQVDLFPIVQTDLLLNALFLFVCFSLKPQFLFSYRSNGRKVADSMRFDSIEYSVIRPHSNTSHTHTINVTRGDNFCSTFLNEMLNGTSEQINCKQLRVIAECCHLHELPLIPFEWYNRTHKIIVK